MLFLRLLELALLVAALAVGALAVARGDFTPHGLSASALVLSAVFAIGFLTGRRGRSVVVLRDDDGRVVALLSASRSQLSDLVKKGPARP